MSSWRDIIGGIVRSANRLRADRLKATSIQNAEEFAEGFLTLTSSAVPFALDGTTSFAPDEAALIASKASVRMCVYV